MYFENSDTVLAMKQQTTVVSRNEMGMSGPALRAMTGNVKMMLVAGAICVMPCSTSSESPSELRRSCGAPMRLIVSEVTMGLPLFTMKRGQRLFILHWRLAVAPAKGQEYSEVA